MMDKPTLSAVQAVVLCGGAGARLWPLSRPDLPKPFIPLVAGRSLLDLTLARVQQLGAPALLVTSEATRFQALQAARQQGSPVRLLLEDQMRNTAVAMTLAALSADAPDALQLFCPADHLIPDEASFLAALETGIPAAQAGAIVTWGIAPVAPNPAYGYMLQGPEVQPGSYRVERFIEKPDVDTATALLKAGSVFWNSGIFMCRAKTLLAAMQRHSPEILACCEAAMAQGTRDSDWPFVRPDPLALADCPSISFDKAVMEHHPAVVMVPYAGAWTDVGSWDALVSLSAPDSRGNRLQGRAWALQSDNTDVHAQSRVVVTLGTQDLIVVETPDAVLVSRKDLAQDVRQVPAVIAAEAPDLSARATRVIRAWGWYEEIQRGPGYRIKMLGVAPGARLSMQSHQHRSEHWYVLSGQATVRLEAGSSRVDQNQSIFIPQAQKHQLINRGAGWLHIIETQTGAYLEEDDITRYELPPETPGDASAS